MTKAVFTVGRQNVVDRRHRYVTPGFGGLFLYFPEKTLVVEQVRPNLVVSDQRPCTCRDCLLGLCRDVIWSLVPVAGKVGKHEK